MMARVLGWPAARNGADSVRAGGSVHPRIAGAQVLVWLSACLI